MNAQDFVPAIREHPDDDTPRLVCADWFEEHGQPERAELIRAQVELARARRPLKRHRKLRERARELLAAHEEEWAGPLLDLVDKVGFRRGFIERVTLTTADFLDGAEQIFALAPVREAVFVKAGPGLRRLADCPHLARLERLDFRDTRGEDRFPELFASPHLGGLRAFALRMGGYGEPVVAALAGAARPPELAELDLYDAGLPVESVATLAAWPGATRLETLVLGGNNLDDGAAVPLANSPHLARLRMLHLAFAQLGDSDAQALAASPHLAGLRRLDLRHNGIGGTAAQALRHRFGDRVQL